MSDFISLDDAVKITKIYRQIGSKAHGFFISKAAIQELFEQDAGIDGIRIYNAIDGTDGKFEIIACVSGTVEGANPEIHDDYMVPQQGEPMPLELPKIAIARPCPYNCGKQNQLNS